MIDSIHVFNSTKQFENENGKYYDQKRIYTIRYLAITS